MSNRFDAIPARTEHVSTFIPLPLDYMQQALESKQKAYDDTLTAADKLQDEIFKVNAISQHSKFKQDLQKEYSGEIESLAQELADTGDVSKAREITNLSRRWNNDARRQEMESSFIDYNLDQKDVFSLKKEGTYTPVYDAWSGFTGTNEDGTMKGYRAQGARPAQDYGKYAADLVSGIAKQGKKSGYYGEDKYGNYIGYKEGWEGVRDADILRTVNGALEPFLTSTPGQFFIDELRYYNKDISGEDIKAIAKQYLTGIANKQKGEITFDDDSFKYDKNKANGIVGNDKNDVPNTFVQMVSPVTTSIADKSLDDLFTPGKNVPGSHSVNLDKSISIFGNIPNMTVEATRMSVYDQQINSIWEQKGIGSKVRDSATGYPSAAITILKDQDKEGSYYAAGYGPEANIYKTEKDGTKTKLGTAQSIAENAVKNSTDYALLKADASEHGFDIESEEYKKQMEEINVQIPTDIRRQLGQVVQVGGRGDFVVNDGQNKVNVDDKVFIGGKVIMTDAALDAAFDQQNLGRGLLASNQNWAVRTDWEDIYLEPEGQGYGQILPFGTNDKGEKLWAINVQKEIAVSQTNSDIYNTNSYGQADFDKLKPGLDAKFQEFKNSGANTRITKVYNESYDRNPELFIKETAKAASYLTKPSQAAAEEVMKRIDAKSPEEKKEYYINLRRQLRDKNAAESIFRNWAKDPKNKFEVPTFHSNNTKAGKAKVGQKK